MGAFKEVFSTGAKKPKEERYQDPFQDQMRSYLLGAVDAYFDKQGWAKPQPGMYMNKPPSPENPEGLSDEMLARRNPAPPPVMPAQREEQQEEQVEEAPTNPVKPTPRAADAARDLEEGDRRKIARMGLAANLTAQQRGIPLYSAPVDRKNFADMEDRYRFFINKFGRRS